MKQSYTPVDVRPERTQSLSPFTARQRIFDEEESELDMSVFANNKGDQIEELAYKQAFYTTVFLSAAAILWAVVYFNYLLLSVYFTPITWAVLCSIPLRRWQNKLLKEIERERFLLLIVWRISKGLLKMPESLLSFDFSRSALEKITGDALTGCLVLACAIWVAISRPVEWLGWGPGILFFSLLFLVHPLIVLGFNIAIPICSSIICRIVPFKVLRT
ncbi:hypothetical protein GUITHDRAFT_152878 [Guillardia theta CCMP2712]|uniref:Uncharacterized protein n=1 Tax=Guillardia theta (strain CCMP2712) TaxID=905079 RepID=L1J9R5_GUITC|nr:hypothetical protein GUITHDRAFT_152878 [Guillardia theta CCMP2712]EKX44839.1 hypothetical protein GUITHDRAFT_152878 [Guillardia theta CCMP2712]|eukprot:XP_005831819.1 hypothetical protein GUITHDRAFT_152878 [Guillardia theta CCMP2712]